MATGTTLNLTAADSGRNFTGLLIEGQRNAVNADGCNDVTFRDCTFLNCGGGAVGMIRCKNWRFENCDVHGAGLTEWDKRGADCFGVKRCSDIFWMNCRVSGASHDLFTVLDGVGGRLEWRSCTFGKLDPRCKAPGNGASHFTVKRGVNGILVQDCYFTGAPDWRHSVVNPESGTRFHAYGMQLSGTGHKILRCTFERNAGGFLLSSDSGGQVLQGCRFEDLYILDCSMENDPQGNPASAVMMQQGGPVGSISGNTFERVRVWGAKQLTHLALPGVGNDLAGNRFLDCAFGNGPLVVVGKSFATVEGAAGTYSSFSTSKTILTRPIPGTPPEQPPTQPPTAGPVLTAITPNPCKPGDLLRFQGQGFPGSWGYCIVPTDEHPDGQRFRAATWAANEVRVQAPANVRDGETWLTYTTDIRPNRSNRLQLRVTEPAPPEPEPEPEPPPPGPPTDSPSTAEEVLILVNQERSRVDVAPLIVDGRLQQAAQKHAEWMLANKTMSHAGANGSSPFDRMRAEGYPGQSMAENVAWGFTSSWSVMGAWMNSAGHRANILNAGYTDLGVGIAGNYWCQTFGGRPGVPKLPLAPVVDAAMPNQARAGETVALTGKRFGAQAGTVFFAGGATGKVETWSDTNIKVLVVPTAQTGLLVAMRADGQSGATYFYRRP